MNDWQKFDNELIWHPFSNCNTEQKNILIERGYGAKVYDQLGNSYLDLISSWWVNLHGHSHPKIAEAIYRQSQHLEHLIFAGFTHTPAIQLCQSLSQILPEKLCKFFFSDNGSTAVEVAIKMAYQYWYIQGQNQKKLFLSFTGGYHGDTFGAMALGKSSGFHEPFESFFFKVLTCPFPATWKNDSEVEMKEKNALQHLQNILDKYKGNIAAMIIEPIVQGSSGMQMCRPSFIEQLVNLLSSYDVLVIFDEVMTGFGRTGKTFAMDYINLKPDMICLSKGLSGGFLPLALTVVQKNIFDVFSQVKSAYTFAHGHSYTANPIACASACASLELLLDETTQNQIQNITKQQENGLVFLEEELNDYAKNFRSTGTISAFQFSYPVTKNFKEEALKKGLILRPLNQQLYMIPPYCIEQNELTKAYETIVKLIKKYPPN